MCASWSEHRALTMELRAKKERTKRKESQMNKKKSPLIACAMHYKATSKNGKMVRTHK